MKTGIIFWLGILCVAGLATFEYILSSQFSVIDAIENLVVNLEVVPRLRRRPISQTQLIGAMTMKKSTLTIIGLGKDMKLDHLKRSVELAESTGRKFKSYQFIAMLNYDQNSPDLHELQLMSNNWDNNESRKLIIELTSSNHSNSVREHRLSHARNLALMHYRKMNATDYVMMIDLDIIGWNEDSLLRSFGLSNQWDVVCANGVILHGIYRDVYAFRAPGIETNHHLVPKTTDDPITNYTTAIIWKHRLAAQRMVSTKPTDGSKLLRVNSCFGGLAVYRSNAIENCWYSHRRRTPPFPVDCEHVQFNKCVQEQNGGNITIDPNLIVWYGHTDFFSAKSMKSVYDLLKFQLGFMSRERK